MKWTELEPVTLAELAQHDLKIGEVEIYTDGTGVDASYVRKLWTNTPEFDPDAATFRLTYEQSFTTVTRNREDTVYVRWSREPLGLAPDGGGR